MDAGADIYMPPCCLSMLPPLNIATLLAAMLMPPPFSRDAMLSMLPADFLLMPACRCAFAADDVFRR